MRRFLALVAFFWAIGFVIVGVPPLITGGPELHGGSVTSQARGGMAPTMYFRFTDGVLVLGRRPEAHMIDGYAYVPLLAPEAAAAATEGGGFDLAKAREAVPADRTFVVRLPMDAFREAAQTGSGSQVLGPFEVVGLRQYVWDWPESVRTFMTDELGIPESETFCIEHGEHPHNRAFGVTAIVLGALCFLGGRRLWRRRARPAMAREQGKATVRHTSPNLDALPTGCRRVVAPLAGGAVLLAVIFARNADTLFRSADDAAGLRQLRTLDDVARGARIVSDDPLELVLNGVDLTKRVTDVHRYLTQVLRADVTVQGIQRTNEVREVYERVGANEFTLVATREVVDSTLVRDGTPMGATREVDEEPPDAARGELTRLILRPENNTIRTEAAVRIESGKLVKFDVDASATCVEGTWSEYEAGQTIRLRYTDAGLERVRSALEEQIRSAAKEVGDKMRTAGFERYELDVEVLELANVNITANRDNVVAEADGSTVIRFSLAGWR